MTSDTVKLDLQYPRLEAAPQPLLGAAEWFQVGECERVEQVIESMKRIGMHEIRVNVSWADYHQPEGPHWYDWMLPRLARDLNVLPCFVGTPPKLSRSRRPSAPPREVSAFADFIEMMIARHEGDFEWVELWNEPTNLSFWDWRLDPEWTQFGQMIRAAAISVHQLGKKTVLPGLNPADPSWLSLMCWQGVMDHIDAVGIQARPSEWESLWTGWDDTVLKIRAVLDRHGFKPEIWATNASYSTWRHDEIKQVELFLDGLDAPLQRLYWYNMHDLDPTLPSPAGFHADERHYHLGMIRVDGSPKLLYRMLEKGGISAVKELHHYTRVLPVVQRKRKPVAIIGGSGFIGSNVADRLARRGRQVVIYDNLSRPGVEENLAWLREKHRDRIVVEIADVQDAYILKHIVRRADQLYHFAAQVAMTTSLTSPAFDFEVNAHGTFNLLEAMRQAPKPPQLIFTSTNKVYGKLGHVRLEERKKRYVPLDAELRALGVGEHQTLDFFSPYGCSKGAADQYVLDYARIYKLPAVVFRMSCIYGPHQFGTEDQGWLAHFLINALSGEPITIFGNGKQVRDALFVDDLVEAFLLAQANMETVRGQAFNIGGGPANSISLLELIEIITRLTHRQPVVFFGPWRPGDQMYYTANIQKFQKATGWVPKVSVQEGVTRLFHWLQEARFAAQPATLQLEHAIS